jgi:hypothetical protein
MKAGLEPLADDDRFFLVSSLVPFHRVKCVKFLQTGNSRNVYSEHHTASPDADLVICVLQSNIFLFLFLFAEASPLDKAETVLRIASLNN